MQIFRPIGQSFGSRRERVNFTFEYLKRLQNSELLHTNMNPTSCLFGLRFVQNPFFLLAGALLFTEKICQSVALFWYGLRDVRVSSIFFSQAVIRRPIVDFPAFLETGLPEKIAVCYHTTCDPNKQKDQMYFCMKQPRALKSFQKFRSKLKNQKPIDVDILFQVYPMVPLSCRSNMAGRHL